LLGATAWLAWWGIRRGLFPLQALAQQAAEVSAQSWKLQPPKEAEEIEELRPLTEAMTQMLGRLGTFLRAATRISRQRGPRVEDSRGGTEIHPAIAVAASQEFQRNIAPVCRPRCRIWPGWSNCCNGMLRLARAEQRAQDSGRRELEVMTSTHL